MYPHRLKLTETLVEAFKALLVHVKRAEKELISASIESIVRRV